MKRVLLDHRVPRQLGRLLAGHSVSTAAREGWAGLENGDLLSAAETAGFEVLITSDKNLRYQQNLAQRKIAIIELPTNRLRLVVKSGGEVMQLLARINPGDYLIAAS
jgi:predicted nuclease of predicted toxin-antitoxin system